jgi:hypothetical protein
MPSLRLRGGVGIDNDVFKSRMSHLKDMVWKEIREKDGYIEAGLDDDENITVASKRAPAGFAAPRGACQYVKRNVSMVVCTYVCMCVCMYGCVHESL